MIIQEFPYELITPCFCGGVRPYHNAFIRGPSIRGILRWWFRALGGFVSLNPMPLPEQERFVFGGKNLNKPINGSLITRILPETESEAKCFGKWGVPSSAQDHSFAMPAYFSFPIEKGRACIFPPYRFTLQLCWRGQQRFIEDIVSLATVFGCLGSIGLRAKRGFGAIKPLSNNFNLPQALTRFLKANNLIIKSIPSSSLKDAVNNLAHWLKQWREWLFKKPGFKTTVPVNKYVKSDHDIGLKIAGGASECVVFKPALGLPIIQNFSTGKSIKYEIKLGNFISDRFASPVILRPYQEMNGQWFGLVIFIESHKWPDNAFVLANKQVQKISLELYEAMKSSLPDHKFLCRQ
jgi:CRISPR type III-B/RAMP module RAMP protein Cmr1